MILKVGLVTTMLVSTALSDHGGYSWNYSLNYDDGDYYYDYYNYDYDYYYDYDYDNEECWGDFCTTAPVNTDEWWDQYYDYLEDLYASYYVDYDYQPHWIDESTYVFNGSGFRVLSGHDFCRVENDGCVSTGLHAPYRNREECEFEWVGPGKITADFFDVEYAVYCEFDSLTVESTGERFCGNTGPKNFNVETTERFTWRSDLSVMDAGFRLCGVAPEPCKLSQWSEWGDCDDVCAGGMKTRSREIVSGAEACPADAVFEEQTPCNEDIECNVCEDVIIHTGDFGGGMVWSMEDFRGNTCDSVSYDENQKKYKQECCMRIGDFVALDLKSVTGNGWQGGSLTVFGQQFTMESGTVDMRNLRWEKPPTETPEDMVPMCEQVLNDGKCKEDCAYVFDDPDFPTELIPDSLRMDICFGTQGLYTFQCPTECHTREDMRELCHVVKQRGRCDEPCGWVLADPDLAAITPDHITTALCLGEGAKYIQLCPSECQSSLE